MSQANQDDPQAAPNAGEGQASQDDPQAPPNAGEGQANQDDPQAPPNAGEGNVGRGTDLPDPISKIDENFQRCVKQAFVLANLYFFFQGAILTAVSQVSSPKCSQWYFFLVLSVIPLLLNGFPLIYVLNNCAKAKNEYDRCKIAAEKKRADGDGTQEVKADEYSVKMRCVGVRIVGVFLIAFNGVILYGCRSLLCDNNQSTPIISFNGDCFRVCNDLNKCLQICTQ